MMGTRSGSIDPGVIFYLIREFGMSPAAVESMLLEDSGLKGICGFKDMRDVLSHHDSKSKLAFEMFVHSVSKYIGAMAASLNGVEVLVFTGGIGENAVPVREAVCKKLEFLGVENILVIPANEDWQIAKQTYPFVVSD